MTTHATGTIIRQAHVCQPPRGTAVSEYEAAYPPGSVWRCDCGRSWISFDDLSGEWPDWEWKRAGVLRRLLMRFS